MGDDGRRNVFIFRRHVPRFRETGSEKDKADRSSIESSRLVRDRESVIGDSSTIFGQDNGTNRMVVSGLTIQIAVSNLPSSLESFPSEDISCHIHKRDTECSAWKDV